ncbi:glycosyltransferase family 2 protein [Rhodococcus gannanensis]|uniref:Glycosyltransferase family 2 protein n=1 Tax=Rhodococcus gannanensis TaxID=1960308 RepID=A0ABW4PCI9_9NOCA
MALPSLSVVVPAFNEEDTITATLDHLFAQIDEIDEIVVVNNNSTDRTEDVLREFQVRHPKLKVVNEPRRGVSFARNTGLNAATSDVIARLDADTLAQPGWARAIRNYFASAPGTVGIATGPLLPFDSPFRNAFTKSNDRMIARARAASSDGRSVVGLRMAPGGNMVIRRSAWSTVRAAVSDRTDIHDDLDLSLCARRCDFSIAFILGMEAETSARRFRTNPVAYWRYTNLLTRTYKTHGMTPEARATRVEVWNNRAVHLVTWLPTRAYDPQSRRFSFTRMFTPEQDRITGRPESGSSN